VLVIDDDDDCRCQDPSMGSKRRLGVHDEKEGRGMSSKKMKGPVYAAVIDLT
jgi:hypothetical protein